MYVLETEKSQLGRILSISLVSPAIILIALNKKYTNLHRFFLSSIGIVTFVQCLYAYLETEKKIKKIKKENKEIKDLDDIFHILDTNIEMREMYERNLSYIEEVKLTQGVRFFDLLLFSPILFGIGTKKQLTLTDRSLLLSMSIISLGYNIYYLIDYYKKQEEKNKLEIIYNTFEDLNKKIIKQEQQRKELLSKLNKILSEKSNYNSNNNQQKELDNINILKNKINLYLQDSSVNRKHKKQYKKVKLKK